jgi:hypothetical protein
MKVNYNGKKVDFAPLLQVLQANGKLLFAVEALKKKITVSPQVVSAVMFNILGFYVQLLEDSEQNAFVKETFDELNDMITNGFDKFDRGEKIK